MIIKDGKKWYGLEDLEKRLGPPTIATFLNSWRLCEEMSQKDFARLLGISPANLCDIEKGRKGVGVQKLAKIAKTLGYPAELLIQFAMNDELRRAKLKYRVEVKPAA